MPAMSLEKIKINQINQINQINPFGIRGEKETLLELTLFNTNATSKLPLIDNLFKGPPTRLILLKDHPKRSSLGRNHVLKSQTQL